MTAAACDGSSSTRVATPTTSTTELAVTGAIRTRSGPIAQAVGALGEYLTKWQHDGRTAAASTYLVSDADRTGAVPASLTSGTVHSFRIAGWNTADEFTLLVSLDLHFPETKGSGYVAGLNERFVTFTRADSDQPFHIAIAPIP